MAASSPPCLLPLLSSLPNIDTITAIDKMKGRWSPTVNSIDPPESANEAAAARLCLRFRGNSTILSTLSSSSSPNVSLYFRVRFFLPFFHTFYFFYPPSIFRFIYFLRGFNFAFLSTGARRPLRVQFDPRLLISAPKYHFGASSDPQTFFVCHLQSH